jgi:hypothetical protein
MTKAKAMMDMETSAVISALYRDSERGAIEIEPHVYQKRLALNLMLTFCYGTRITTVTDPMLLQILKDATTIARYSSPTIDSEWLRLTILAFAPPTRTLKILSLIYDIYRGVNGNQRRWKCVLVETAGLAQCLRTCALARRYQ